MAKREPYLPQPVLSDSLGIQWFSLDKERHAQLKIAARRYKAWAEGGREREPLPSGVGFALRYDRIIVKRSAPVGGYGPGTAADLTEDTDGWVGVIERALQVNCHMPYHWELVKYKLFDRGDLTHEQLADELMLHPDFLKDEWRKLSVRLYFGIYDR